jgi:ssDNA thymidine ADP-ribosyltransferase, DarT
MPIDNVSSVLERGILSHERASKLAHHSVAMQEVQDRRDQRQVPGGLKLHQYANLYFHARNPMLYKRRDKAAELCVLRVSIEARHVQGVVFTDSNASSDYVRFLHPSQWALLNFTDIYAMDWRHPNDPIAYYRIVPASVPRCWCRIAWNQSS